MALTIGELGRATGTKVETVRYYERIGLLPEPGRTGGNYRAYGRVELERLSFIRRARDLGFSLDQVRALLALSDDTERDCSTVDAIAREHLSEVERKLADLTALRRELKAMVASCSGGSVGECRIIEALAPVDLPLQPIGSKDCAVSCMAALPAATQLAAAPTAMAMRTDPFEPKLGHPAELDVETPPPRRRQLNRTKLISLTELPS